MAANGIIGSSEIRIRLSLRVTDIIDGDKVNGSYSAKALQTLNGFGLYLGVNSGSSLTRPNQIIR